MKAHIIQVATLLLLVIACDAPQRIRMQEDYASSLNQGNTTGSNGSGFNGGSTTGSSNGGGTTGSSNGGSNSQSAQCINYNQVIAANPNPNTSSNAGTNTYVPGSQPNSNYYGQYPTQIQQGFEPDTCMTFPGYTSTATGAMSICQSKYNDTYFRVAFTQEDQAEGTCLVPMYKASNGSSTYLGSAQCTKHAKLQLIYGTLSKTRPQYQSAPVNAVMVFKAHAVQQFFDCMDGYNNYVKECCPNNSSDSTCQQNAGKYMNIKCSQFKSANSYIDLRLRY